MLSALFLVFALIVLLIIYDRIKYRRTYELLGKFPGPKNVPLLGAAYDFRSIDVIVGTIIKFFKLYGPTSAFWIFRVPMVVISDPKHLKIFLTNENCMNREKRYLLSKELFGNGLILAPAKLWKRNRKLVGPAYNLKITESFMDVFVKLANLMLENMEKNIPENELFDMDHFFVDYALDILLESGMGIDEKQPRPPGFLNDINRIGHIIIQRSFQVWLHPDFIFRKSPLEREYHRAMNKLNTFFRTIIEKSYDKFHSQDREELSFLEGNKRKPFLEHLLSMEHKFTIQELRDEVAVFLSAGVDTTSASFAYLFVCLGALKDIQEKVAEELLDVFGESKLQYLERVIKESMRLFPCIPFYARQADEDIDLGDYVIPKGTSVIVSHCQTHRNEEFYPDPLKFDPDRFLPSEVAKRHPYSYLPFGGGPRNCLGQHYAIMSMKIMAAFILRKYKIDTNIKLEKIKSSLQIVAKITGGANVSIEKRYK